MTKPRREPIKEESFVENVDYYFENGLMILTENFLKKRGYCCRNNCRHCPYSFKPNELQQKNL